MIKKLNITLAVIAVIGALFCGGMYAYNHFSDVQNSKVIQQLGGV